MLPLWNFIFSLDLPLNCGFLRRLFSTLSDSLSFLSHLRDILLLIPLSHISLLPLVLNIHVFVRLLRHEEGIQREASRTQRKGAYATSESVRFPFFLYFFPPFFFFFLHTLRHSADLMLAIISSDRPAFHFNKPASLKQRISERLMEQKRGRDVRGWEKREISKK